MLALRPSSPDARPQVPISFPLRLRPTPYIEQHGFRDAIHFPAHLLGPRCSVRPGLAWIPYVLAIVWIPYVQATHGFYTSQPSVDSIRPAHTGCPTHPTQFMDSICPNQVWNPYVQGPCGSCMSVAFEPECQTLESSLRSVYG